MLNFVIILLTLDSSTVICANLLVLAVNFLDRNSNESGDFPFVRGKIKKEIIIKIFDIIRKQNTSNNRIHIFYD